MHLQINQQFKKLLCPTQIRTVFVVDFLFRFNNLENMLVNLIIHLGIFSECLTFKSTENQISGLGINAQIQKYEVITLSSEWCHWRK